MQLLSTHKKISLSLLMLFACTIPASSLHAADVPVVAGAAASPEASKGPHPFDVLTTKKVTTASLLALAIASFLWLKLKKTQPKCVYPKFEQNDSFTNIFKNVMKCIWFTFDEILAGQSSKGERVSKIHFNPENPYEGTYEYSKIEPRGIAGNLEAMLKPAIIPAFTLMVLFNKEFKDKLAETIVDTLKFIDNPTAWFDHLKDVYKNVELPKKPATPTT